MVKINFERCALFLLVFSVSSAHASTGGQCFNFDSPVTAPLKTQPKWTSSKDTSRSGVLPAPTSGNWGAVRGTIDQPIQALYNRLLDHYTIKDPKRAKLRVYSQDRTGYDHFDLVMVQAIVPLMDIHWEEEWAYAISQGSPGKPQEIVISYQKTNGTSYIPHLCGSIVLRSSGPKSTDVYLYEEVNALGKRSPQDTIKGHLGTLATLRKEGSVVSQK